MTDSLYHSESDFNKDLITIFSKIVNEKLTDFLEFCVLTHNAEPIKQIVYILSVNQFDSTDGK